MRYVSKGEVSKSAVEDHSWCTKHLFQFDIFKIWVVSNVHDDFEDFETINSRFTVSGRYCSAETSNW